MNIINNIKNNFQKNVRNIGIQGIGVTLTLSIVVIILASNIYRVIEKGQSNLEIYQFENELLQQQIERNRELEEKYNYVNSDEYKILLAREVLGLAEPGEELFLTKEDPEFYLYKPELLDVKQKDNFIDWWLNLILGN